MSENIVDDYSKVTVKIEENVDIKTEVIDTDDSDTKNPLSDFIQDERGNVVEFYEGETQVAKPEPIEHGPPANSDIVESGYCVGKWIESKLHVCSECNKAFSQKTNLKYHVSSVHLKLKEFVCGECKRAFTKQRSLNIHVDAVHKKIRKYACSECARAFARRGDLNKHSETVHRKLKKFLCTECDHAFTRQEVLKAHIDAVHRKLKKHACGDCNRAFATPGDLNIHVNTIHKKIKKHAFVCARDFDRQGT